MHALARICQSYRAVLVVAGMTLLWTNYAIAVENDSEWSCDILMHATTSELRVDHCMLPPTRQGIRIENMTNDRQLEVKFGKCTFTPIGVPDIVVEGWTVKLAPGQALIREEGYPERTEAHSVECEPPQIVELN